MDKGYELYAGLTEAVEFDPGVRSVYGCSSVGMPNFWLMSKPPEEDSLAGTSFSRVENGSSSISALV